MPKLNPQALLRYLNPACLINGFFKPQTYPIRPPWPRLATFGPNLKAWPNPTQSIKKEHKSQTKTQSHPPIITSLRSNKPVLRCDKQQPPRDETEGEGEGESVSE